MYGNGEGLNCTAYNCCGRLWVFIWTEIWLPCWRLVKQWLGVRCTQQSCLWYCLCCNIWLCWLVFILIWVIAFVWMIIGMVIGVVWCLVCGFICILNALGEFLGRAHIP